MIDSNIFFWQRNSYNKKCFYWTVFSLSERYLESEVRIEGKIMLKPSIVQFKIVYINS